MKTNSVSYSEFGCQQRGLDGFFSTCEIGENEFIWAQLDSKGQLISKANFEVFIWTKKRTKYFYISALASKIGQIIKIMAHYHAN